MTPTRRHPVHAHARRHLEGRVLPRAPTCPTDPAERDDLLLRVMGSPDPRQIDGLGGAHPLTSKVAVVAPSPDGDADVDYLFLQVVPDQPIVTDAQTCGNLLAGRRTVRDRTRPRRGGGRRDRGAHPHREPDREHRRGARADARRPACATTATPMMAGTPFPAAADPPRLPRRRPPVFPTGRLVDRFAGTESPAWTPGCRWCSSGPPTSASTATSAGRPRGERSALRSRSSDPPRGGSGHGTRRRARHDGAEDHHRLAAARTAAR